MSIYTTPRAVTNVEDCYFYHTMDIPGHGTVHGEWDLRGGEHEYLGGVELAGKRVLELGPASGFLTVHMERQGADVVAYDLSEDYSWDVVPFDGTDFAVLDDQRRQHLRKLNNGFWLNHAANESRSTVAYGTIYTVPEEIGPVDIVTFASILLHVRDPFLALRSGTALAKDTVVVTDAWPATDLHLVQHLEDTTSGGEIRPLDVLGEPKMSFMPQHWDRGYADTWWHMTPAIVRRFLGVLGFTETEVSYHYATAGEQRILLYTVVGHRG
ncbi:class I SAM-dependent methyltransferase [Herbihabitans rhizosphaerae]|uniref:class I SAM-dependent methyltransferase n=1 Tax=Herbihabitans rhizosphaerae TaxID=1872711 RepID=UPI00102CB638|nr:methyltransferase domain-containing protein [Herbihabitans rhizosphaerae]